MVRIIHFIEAITERVGRAVSYLTTALMLLICVDVLMRYFFEVTKIWVIELEIYFYALIFLLGSAYAFKHDKHVRVDVFYANWSPKRQAWTNLIGGLCLLLPWCVVIMLVSRDYFLNSWVMGESSPQAGGLPALYLLKSSIFIGFSLLFLQGIASILRSILVIQGKSNA